MNKYQYKYKLNIVIRKFFDFFYKQSRIQKFQRIRGLALTKQIPPFSRNDSFLYLKREKRGGGAAAPSFLLYNRRGLSFRT
jgi:hypothetical protein